MITRPSDWTDKNLQEHRTQLEAELKYVSTLLSAKWVRLYDWNFTGYTMDAVEALYKSLNKMKGVRCSVEIGAGNFGQIRIWGSGDAEKAESEVKMFLQTAT